MIRLAAACIPAVMLVLSIGAPADSGAVPARDLFYGNAQIDRSQVEVRPPHGGFETMILRRMAMR